MLISFLAGLAVLLVTYAIGTRTGKHRVVDVAWGLAFSAIVVAVFFQADGLLLRRVLLTGLTVVWGVRLATHIYLRGRGAPEDPRYEALLARGGNPLVRVYLLQAVIAYFISLPVQLGQYQDAPLRWWSWLGVAVWAVGFYFEAVGDYQLVKFTGNPANKGKLLDYGLWRYTRHPNYFGDAAVWWGLFLVSLATWWQLALIVCPLAMTWLLVSKTGKPLTEARMSKTRPGYAEYIRRTSGFIPLPPKR